MKMFILLFLALLCSCSHKNKESVSLYLEESGEARILRAGKIVPASREMLSELWHYDFDMEVNIFVKAEGSLKSRSLIKCAELVAESGFTKFRLLDSSSQTSFGIYEFEGNKNSDIKYNLYTRRVGVASSSQEHRGRIEFDGICIYPISVTSSGAFFDREKIGKEKLESLLRWNCENNTPTIVECTVHDDSLVKDWIYLMKVTNDASPSAINSKFVIKKW